MTVSELIKYLESCPLAAPVTVCNVGQDPTEDAYGIIRVLRIDTISKEDYSSNVVLIVE